MTWINEYLILEHGTACRLEIIDDIDHWYVPFILVLDLLAFILVCRIFAVPAFPGLCRFPDGCNFKQWTGDDSKALMKVSWATCFYPYNLIPVRYTSPQLLAMSHQKWSNALQHSWTSVWHNAITSDTLHKIKNMLAEFHHHHEIFIQTGVHIDIYMPRQHALKHYHILSAYSVLPTVKCFLLA